MRVRERIKAWRGEALLGALWLCRVLCKPHGLRNVYRSILIHLVKKTDLFDRAYYLEANGDIAQTPIPPLRHYVAYGDREGRAPMALFDPAYYRSHAQGRTKHVNALLHYAHVGRYRRISPSPWFDVEYYLANNKDVARSGIDPLLHYLKWGGLEGRSPSPQFDGAYYLRSNPDVVEARLNPLIHYLQFGRFAERPIMPSKDTERSITSRGRICPAGSDDEAWEALSPWREERPVQVDILVPVYKDRGLTLRCLYSVLTSKNKTSFELIVIDDGSPDQDLVADLNRLADRGLFTLLRNECNRGFVQTVNRGMALHGSRDVVLLNADTEVYGNWLDRLYATAYRHPRTATVTPLSNNATICSYPRFLYDNPYPLETNYETLDELAARANAGFEVEAPTGVGFCMYLRRDSLREVGFFDEAAFGKGYGEENDWCQRAIRHGWRNVIAADVFVRHVGGASFQGEKAKRIAAAMSVLDKRYPGYRKAVDDFIHRDPLAEARRRLDWERLKTRARGENVLIVCHNRGGGAERHVQEDTRHLREQGKGIFYLRPVRGQPTHARLGHPTCRQLANLPTYELADTNLLADALKELRITCIHSHGLVDFTAEAPMHLLSLAKAIGVSLQVDIHDYKVICPRVSLADHGGRYCGEPGEKECDTCLVTQGNNFGARSIREWRALHRRVLKFAEKVWVPDLDVAERLARYYPDVSFTVAPHEPLGPASVTIREPRLDSAERLRIVVIGAVSRIKGYDVLLACARNARKRRLPIDYIVMGYSLNNRLLEQAGVVVTGRYLEHEAEARLCTLAPHAVWLPSTWPETYSYTLSLALKSGYPVFAFDLGAIARRLREIGQSGKLWPLTLADSPSQINTRFIEYRARHLSALGIS